MIVLVQSMAYCTYVTLPLLLEYVPLQLCGKCHDLCRDFVSPFVALPPLMLHLAISILQRLNAQAHSPDCLSSILSPKFTTCYSRSNVILVFLSSMPPLGMQNKICRSCFPGSAVLSPTMTVKDASLKFTGTYVRGSLSRLASFAT